VNTRQIEEVVTLRLVASLLLIPITIVLLLQLPNDVELHEEMVAYSDQGKAELERLWAGTATSSTNNTINVSSLTVEAPPTTNVATSTTTTTTTTIVVLNVRCRQWWTTAVAAGWPNDRIPVLLDKIIWHESRCLPHVDNDGRDIGLTQVNYLVHKQLVANMGLLKDDLYDPLHNLRVALKISEEAESYRWRWCQPWQSSGSHC